MKFRIGGVVKEDLARNCQICEAEIDKLSALIGSRYRQKDDSPIVIRVIPEYSPMEAGAKYIIVRGWHIELGTQRREIKR